MLDELHGGSIVDHRRWRPICLACSALLLAAVSGHVMGQVVTTPSAAPRDHLQNSDRTRLTATETKGKRVLRHAVFFKFKANATQKDIDNVVAAFRALPAKIPEIQDLRWGTNNSPEGLNAGFTHCFLLTFADEHARATYLPHPAHKEFGDVLKPYLDAVFVIDYWGELPEPPRDRELKHAVFFKFRDDATAEGVRSVEEAFAALPSKISTIRALEWGTNNSPEGLADGFTHCFMVTFDSTEDRAAYLSHAAHQAFVEVLKPVLEKVRVVDFWAQP